MPLTSGFRFDDVDSCGGGTPETSNLREEAAEDEALKTAALVAEVPNDDADDDDDTVVDDVRIGAVFKGFNGSSIKESLDTTGRVPGVITPRFFFDVVGGLQKVGSGLYCFHLK